MRLRDARRRGRWWRGSRRSAAPTAPTAGAAGGGGGGGGAPFGDVPGGVSGGSEEMRYRSTVVAPKPRTPGQTLAEGKGPGAHSLSLLGRVQTDIRVESGPVWSTKRAGDVMCMRAQRGQVFLRTRCAHQEVHKMVKTSAKTSTVHKGMHVCTRTAWRARLPHYSPCRSHRWTAMPLNTAPRSGMQSESGRATPTARPPIPLLRCVGLRWLKTLLARAGTCDTLPYVHGLGRGSPPQGAVIGPAPVVLALRTAIRAVGLRLLLCGCGLPRRLRRTVGVLEILALQTQHSPRPSRICRSCRWCRRSSVEPS